MSGYHAPARRAFVPDDGFADWLHTFNSARNQRQRDAVYNALATVERMGPCDAWGYQGEVGIWMLRDLALRACWRAQAYRREHERHDGMVNMRIDHRSEIEALRAAIPALTTLAASPRSLKYAVAFLQAREVLARLVDAMDVLPNQQQKRWEMCLGWPGAPRGATKPIQTSTALAFNLEHLFRQYTGAGRLMGHGIVMPTTGKPCRNQSSRIAAAVCDGYADSIGESVKALLRSNPRLIPWPDPA